ncbi:MAG: hypothetical protein CSA66_03530 [Proteobacteria bacterium]|nr:MAG: hypothetical protein CSA66_03530 [Pseudomonadota bacterium]
MTRPRRVRKASKRRVPKTPPPPQASPDGHAQRLGVHTDDPEEAEGLAGDPSEAGSGAVADSVPAAPAGGDPRGHEDGVDAPAPVDLDKLLRSYIAKVARSVRRDMTYPRAALRAELEGRCVVAVTIDGGGRVVSIALVRSSGHTVLDKAAVAAVSRVERVPPPPTALAWGSREVQVPFTFRLRG